MNFNFFKVCEILGHVYDSTFINSWKIDKILTFKKVGVVHLFLIFVSSAFHDSWRTVVVSDFMTDGLTDW